MAEKISIDVEINVATNKISNLKTELEEIKQQALSIPDFGETMSQNIENAISSISLLSDKLRQANDTSKTIDERQSIIHQINSGI